MAFYWFLLGVLGVWRVTHLLNAEDGPAGILVRLRSACGEGLLGDLLDCFNCLSLVVAAPFAAIIAVGWIELALVWLALSAGAILLERMTAHGNASLPQAHYIEDEEKANELLRQDASIGDNASERRAFHSVEGLRDAGR
jgi:hypothetical protein